MSTVSIPLKCVFKELQPIEIFDLTPLTFDLGRSSKPFIFYNTIYLENCRALNSLHFDIKQDSVELFLTELFKK